jgi:hypothetical protein
MPGDLNPDFLWQRIEAWVTDRWSPRSVVWIVEGPGEWVPPLQPATIETVEKWVGADYQAVVAKGSPGGGLELAELAHYRITGTVGEGPVPAAVDEAFRRLAHFLAAQERDKAGLSSYSVNIGGAIQESWRRDRQTVARALEYSGAADVLRRFRRAPCSAG